MINVQVNGVLVKSDAKDIAITDGKLIVDGIEVAELPEKKSKSHVFEWLSFIVNLIIFVTLLTEFSFIVSFLIFMSVVLVNYLHGMEVTKNKS